MVTKFQVDLGVQFNQSARDLSSRRLITRIITCSYYITSTYCTC